MCTVCGASVDKYAGDMDICMDCSAAVATPTDDVPVADVVPAVADQVLNRPGARRGGSRSGPFGTREILLPLRIIHA